MTEPLVTIGLPYFNSQDYLEFAISSILNQSYKNFELILVNDGSTDNSVKIANSFFDHRIIHLNDGLNKGLVFRLNQIISMAKGEFIARMDSDDIMYYQRIEIQLKVMMERPEIDVVGSFAYSIDSNNSIVGLKSVPLFFNNKQVLKQQPFIHPTVLVRKNWNKKNFYNKDYFRCEDMELWLRTFTSSSFFNLDDPLLFYRENDHFNINNYINSQKCSIRVLKKYNSKSSMLLLKFKYFIKIIIFLFAYYLGISKVLISKRHKRLNKYEIDIAKKRLQMSLNMDAKN